MDPGLIQQFIDITGATQSEAVQALGTYGGDIGAAVSAFLDRGHMGGGGDSGGIGTMSGIGAHDDKEEGRQGYYAGGGEQGGGELILGPKDKPDNREVVEKLFDSARAHGAEEVKPVEKKPETFTGTGFRLGATSSEPIVPQKCPKTKVPEKDTEYALKLIFWKNGFTVNDGSLRLMGDPASAKFIGQIQSGHVPEELVEEAAGRQVNMSLIDKKDEEWVAPKEPLYRAYGGGGMRLGSDGVKVVEQTESRGSVVCDETQPYTTIQIRTNKGDRVVVKLNHRHTVADLYSAVESLTGSRGVLATAYPRKELMDMSVTVIDAGLLNASLMQK